MRSFLKAVFFGIIALFCTTVSGQLTIKVENEPVTAVFEAIESQSDYKIYYAKAWLTNDLISKNYQNVAIDYVLNNLFQTTEINFFITSDNRIILTQNNRIYDQLAQGFVQSGESAREINESFEGLVGPVLLSKTTDRKQTSIATVKIGRQGIGSNKAKLQLSGYVTNSDTGAPIPGLTVFAKRLTKGVVTDENGFYSLEMPAGEHLLETSALGIESRSVNIIMYDDGQYNFVLGENLEQLDEVTVQADARENVENTATGSARIGSEATKNVPLVLGERDVLKIATTLPGITTAGEGSAGFNVRGGKTDQNLILLDNTVIYNPSHFFGLFQAINPFAISDLQVYKASIPVEFGGRLSSVFEITTKVPDYHRVKTELSIGPVTSNALVELPIIKEKSGLMIGGRGAYSDWVLRALDDENLQNSEASFYDLIAKYDHQLNENNKISAIAYYSKDRFSITSDSLFSYSNQAVSLSWNKKINERRTANFILSNSQYTFDIGFEGIANRNFEQGFKINETEFKSQLNYKLNDSHALTYGFAAKLYNIEPGNITPKSETDLIQAFSVPREQALESAIFISDNFKISDKLQLDAGLRYSFYGAMGPTVQRNYQTNIPRSDNSVIDTKSFENFKIYQTYGGPEARVSARYLLTDSLSVKASFDNVYQFIQALSNNTTVSPVDTYKLSDRNIKPQRSNQFSLGIYQNIKAYAVSLEGFYKMQNDITDFKTGAQLSLNPNVETEIIQGKGKAYGVELLLRKKSGKLNGWVGYTYSRSLYQLESEFPQVRVNNGEFFPSNFDKPHDLSVVLNYQLTRRFSFSGNFLYQTGRPVTFPVGNYEFDGNEFVLYSDRNQFRIPNYYRLDLGFNVEGNHKKKKLAHSFWSVSVYNVLGKNNPYSVFFVSQDGEIKALQSSVFAIPIPSITYNLKF